MQPIKHKKKFATVAAIVIQAQALIKITKQTFDDELTKNVFFCKIKTQLICRTVFKFALVRNAQSNRETGSENTIQKYGQQLNHNSEQL